MDAILEQLNLAGKGFVEFAGPMLIQSGVLIVVLLTADFLLRKRLRAVLRYWLWMLVLAKLVLPVTLSAPVSIGSLLAEPMSSIKAVSPVATAGPSEISQPMQLPEYAEAVTEMPGIPAAISVSGPTLSWQGAVFVIWFMVVIVMGLLLLQRAIFVKGLVAQAAEANSLMLDALAFCRRQMGVRGKIGLKVSANATSPAVCGLFRPVILVPQNLGPSLGSGSLRVVLLHELAHIKRGDLWLNLAQTILQIIYFYNPLLWFANAAIRQLREQAVDEAVQVSLGEKAQQYPQTLVEVAKLAFKRPTLSLRLLGVVESKSTLQARIKRMLTRPIPKTAKLGLVGFIAIVIAGMVLLPMARAEKNKEPSIRDNKQFIATLPNGVTVELAGVCDYPGDKARCWSADGSKLDKQIYVKREGDYSNGKYGFIVKVNGPEDLSFAWNKIEASKGYWGSCTVIDDKGNKLDGFQAAITKGANGRDTTNISVGIASGKWKTVAAHNGKSMGINNGISFTTAVETEKGVQIYTSDSLGNRVTQRIVAIDNDGKLHPWKGYTGSVSTSQIRQSIGTFPDLKLHQIKQFEFQTRPYEYVAFKNVSLKPDFKTDVQVEVEKSTSKKSTGTQKRHEHISFKKRTTIREALQFLAKAYEKNIIPSGNVDGLVSVVDLYDVTFEEALKAIVGTHKYIIDSNFIRVYTEEEYNSLPLGVKTDVQVEVEENRSRESEISGQKEPEKTGQVEKTKLKGKSVFEQTNVLVEETGLKKSEPEKILKIVVDENEDSEPEVEVKIPLTGLKIANTVIPKEIRKELEKQGIDLEKILKEVENLEPMTLLEVNEKNGYVLITVEHTDTRIQQVEKKGIAKGLRTLKILVDENADGKQEVSVRIPLVGLKIANAILPRKVKKELEEEGINLDELFKEADKLEPMTLLEVKEKNEHVLIKIEDGFFGNSLRTMNSTKHTADRYDRDRPEGRNQTKTDESGQVEKTKLKGKSVFEQIDGQVIKFISEIYGQTAAKAESKHLSANSHIYYVAPNFVCFRGGMNYYDNWTGRTITGKVRLGGTSYPNQTLYGVTGQELNTQIVPTDNRPNHYQIYWIPDKPLAPEESLYYGWSINDSRKLRSKTGRPVILTMQNQFGSPVIETFFLVLPKELEISRSNPPTGSQKLLNFDVYWWTKTVQQGKNHLEHVKLQSKQVVSRTASGSGKNLIVPGRRVGDFTLGMSVGEVIEMMGEPKELRRGEKNFFMNFDGIAFHVSDDIVDGITVLNDRYKFADGLGVGSTEQQIISAFGEDYSIDETEFKDFLSYKDQGLIFEIKKTERTVMEINVTEIPRRGLDENQQKVRAAVDSAKRWLELVDSGDYDKSYEQAAEFFKKAMPKKQWDIALKISRGPLGKLLSRELISTVYATELPAAPDGEYVVITFKTAYENKNMALEQVTPMLDKDGQWRVSGYYIR